MAGTDITFKGLKKMTKDLDDMARKQIPFAMMRGINETAKEVKKAEDKKIKRVFKKPTKTTQNSVIILFAKKTKLEATVKIKDKPFSGSNFSIADYLAPQIFGGSRSRKGSEKRLQASGRMTKGRSLFPGQGTKLNKFGNIPKGHMTRIMSAVGGHHDAQQNTTAKSKKRNKNVIGFFVVKKGNVSTKHLHPGIYKRVGRKLIPVIIYGKKPKYQVRFRFFDVADKVINKRLTANFSKSLDFALRTAR